MTATGAHHPRRSILAGLLGQGIGPSLTPEMHEREAARQQLRYVYKTVELDAGSVGPGHLSRLLEAAVELGFDGLNVTHPVKQAMVPLVDRVTDEVGAIGALNTVVVRDGETVGHNTDVTGFGRAFRDRLPEVAPDRVMLLGAGGAGTAVAHALVGLGARELLVVDPDRDRGRELERSVARLAAPVQVELGVPADVPDALATVSGLVNATPVGMAAYPGTPVRLEHLDPSLWVVDIVYRPLHTALLQAARERGCRTLSGAGMAVHQAADAFEIFTGRPADRDAMSRDFDDMVAAEIGATTHQTQHDPRKGTPA